MPFYWPNLALPASVLLAVLVGLGLAARGRLDGPKDPFDFRLWITSLWLLGVFLAAEILVGFAWGACQSTGLLWGMGLTACAFVIGFLFAIPKVAQGEPGAKPRDGMAKPILAVNTNLEQISDWLTKIIVGVSLIQLKELEYNVGRLADFIVKQSHTAQGCRVEESTGLAMILFFGPFGFLAGYLITRLFFSALIAQADRLSIGIQDLRNQDLPSLSEGRVELTAQARRTAEQIKTLSPETAVHRSIPLDALMVAQLGTGEANRALETAEAALKDDSTNPRFHYLRALALWNLNDRPGAAEALRSARALLSPAADAALRRSIYQSLVFALLYLPPPRGFTEAAEVCEEYLRTDPTGLNGEMWVNLACAEGQGALYARNTGNEDNFRDHRRRALKAVQQALQIDPNWLSRLRGLLYPSPAQGPQRDDDLAVFQGDPEFEAILGKA